MVQNKVPVTLAYRGHWARSLTELVSEVVSLRQTYPSFSSIHSPVSKLFYVEQHLDMTKH